MAETDYFGGLLDSVGSGFDRAVTGWNNFISPTEVPTGATYSPEQLRMARATLLGNLGATLLSAAQPGQSYSQRAQTIGQLGNVAEGYSKQLGLDPQSELQRLQLQQARNNMTAQNNLSKMISGLTSGSALGIPDRQFELLKQLPGPIQQEVFKGLVSRDPLAVRQAELQIQQLELNLASARSAAAAAWQGLPGAPQMPTAPASAPLPSVPASTLPRVAGAVAAAPTAPASVVPSAVPVMARADVPAPAAPAAPALPAAPAAPTAVTPSGTVQTPSGPQPWWKIADISPDMAIAVNRLPNRDQVIADILKKKAEQTPGMPDPKMSDQEGKLRGEYIAATKEFADRQTAYRTMQDLAKQGEGASDMALVLSIMKVYDPTSTVTGQESANAKNAAGVPAGIIGEYNRLVGGGTLAPAAREQLVNAGRQRIFQEYDSYERATQQAEELAKQYGVDPKRVAVDRRDPEVAKERETFRVLSTINPGSVGRMTKDQLTKLDPYTPAMNEQQKQLVAQRARQLAGLPALAPSAPAAAAPEAAPAPAQATPLPQPGAPGVPTQGYQPSRGMITPSHVAIQRQLELIDMRLALPIPAQERAARERQKAVLLQQLNQPM